ncbi:hypothetical protein [Variovorax sp. PvP013]|uniref:hypothetical protein n=1 Tax=Variovorax sp. PvP013 TaxID=3156435 RepID=UPI003D23EF5F
MAKLSRFAFLAFLASIVCASSVDAEPTEAKSLAPTFSYLIDEQNKHLSRISDQLQTVISGLQKDEGQAKSEEAKNKIEIEDLEAQKDMAHWAKWMFWITLVSSFGALVSLYLLFGSLRQNRASIKVASDGLDLAKTTSEAQLRAYVGITIDESYKDLFVYPPRPHLTLIYKNHGSTPALFLGTARGYEPKPIDSSHEYNYKHKIADPKLTQILMPGQEVRLEHVFFGDIMSTLMLVPLQKSMLHVNAIATYQDVFGNARKTTFRFIIYCGPNKKVMGYLSDDGQSAT